MGGTSGAAAAANQTVNNYLKHEELQAKRQEMAACKTEACTTAVTRKWEAVSQKRDAQMTDSCISGTSAQCHANVQQLVADLASLNQGTSGKTGNGDHDEENNNLQQAQAMLRANLDTLAHRGNEALGTTLTSPNDLAQAGYMTQQEADLLNRMRSGTGEFVVTVTASVLGGAKGSGNRKVSQTASESKTADLTAPKAEGQVPKTTATNPLTKQASNAAVEGESALNASDPLQILLNAKGQRGNFNVGDMTRTQMDNIGMTWVGPSAKPMMKGETQIGWVSSDGLKTYRFPQLKESGIAAVNTQGNLTEFLRLDNGKTQIIRNAHINLLP